MRNACPTCQTVYAVTPADVGRRIVCTRCNASLVIDNDGFRVLDGTDKGKPASGTKPPPADRKKDPDTPRARSAEDDTALDEVEDDEDTVDSDEIEKDGRSSTRGRKGRDKPSPSPKGMFQKYIDIPTAVFALGVVVVLWFLFMPLIGSAKQKWYAARIEDEQLAHDTEVKRLKEKGAGDQAAKKDEEWRKRKEKLDVDVQWVQINNRQSEYWDRYGMLAGFILTALGSVGLLMTHQPLVKKVVGAVVVCAMMILVFISFAWKG